MWWYTQHPSNKGAGVSAHGGLKTEKSCATEQQEAIQKLGLWVVAGVCDVLSTELVLGTFSLSYIQLLLRSTFVYS